MGQLSHIVALFTLVASVDYASATEGWNTFPAPKSENLAGAPAVTSYKTGDGGVEDAHAVVGAATSDGAYILAGKGMECADSCTGSQSASMTDGFAVKMTAAGTQVWSWSSGVAGANDALNGVVELPSGEILLAGWRTVGGVGKRSITKLNAAGTEVWTFTGFTGDVAGAHGALELVTLVGTTDILLSGLREKPDLNEMAFKSYGNSEGGKAWFCKMPISALAGTSPPSASDITWEKTEAAYMSAKAARAMDDGSVAVLLWGSDAKACGIAVYPASGGSATWGPTDHATSSNLEGTDIAINGNKIAISGHGGYLSDGQYYSGKLVIVNAADGLGKTTTEITAGGTRELIYNECWGTDAVSGGFVVACGTGIENCNGKSAAVATDCAAGRGDSSTSNVLFGPGIWQSMAAMIDTSGNLQWRRVDAYRASGDPTYTDGSAFTATTSSASEWVVAKSDGTTAWINDETNGFGIMMLAAPSSGSGTTPSSSTGTTTGGGGGGSGSSPSSTDMSDGGAGSPQLLQASVMAACVATLVAAGLLF